MTAFIGPDGRWRIPCITYKVDDKGKPIPGSAEQDSMLGHEAASALAGFDIQEIKPPSYLATQAIKRANSINISSIKPSLPLSSC